MKEKPKRFSLKKNRICFLLAGCFCLFAQAISAQTTISEITSPADARLNRERGLQILNEVRNVIKDNYYDPNFRGMNLDERFKAAAAKVKSMSTNSQIFRVIAQVLIEFNDSHTSFFPPSRTNTVDYGFSLQVIGNDCFVVNVEKGSDAEAKGLEPGDIVLRIGPFNAIRENLWKIRYLIYALDPQPNLNLGIKNLDGNQREVAVTAKIRTPEERSKEAQRRKEEEKETPYKCREISSDLIACKLYTFSADTGVIDKMMKDVGRHKNFILDLRGNRGGYVETEKELVGWFFDHDVKVGDEVMRRRAKEEIARSRKEKAYGGDLIVLIDSDSASAAEVFARVIQIEKRGKIVGDISAGAVMTALYFPLAVGHGNSITGVFTEFSVNVTVADLKMSDGSRLEGIGVRPDLPVGPTAYALLKKTDPVLSFAASKFGASLTPEEAGEFHFMRKKSEDNDADDA